MTPLSPDAARDAIERAWQHSTPPARNRISTPTYDDEGVAAYFQGRSWQGHDVESLRYHSVGLSFFTAEAFCYYLPAYMLAVLADVQAADVIYDGILFHLSPRQLGRTWADSYRARIAGFSDDQKQAIAAYLAWCRARYDDPTSQTENDEIGETIAYLLHGAAPIASSSTQRLLQLGGADGRAPQQVDRLRLSCTAVTDADLAGLAEFTSLRELDLGHTKLTDEGLAHLSRPAIAAALSGLGTLDLSSGKQYSAAGLRHVATLPRLAELQLPNADIDDAGLRALSPLALRQLNLVHCRRLTDAGWDALNVSELETLSMFGVDAPDALLSRLGAAGKLRVLECKSVSSAGLRALCQGHALGRLDIGVARALSEDAGVGLAALATLPALQRLGLNGLRCGAWPAGFPALTELTLLGGELSAEAAAGLARLPALGELGLFGERLAPEALRHLATLRALRRLSLWCDDLTDAQVLDLAGSPLQHLSVHKAPITSAAFARIRELTALTSLEIDRLAIDDGAMHLLSQAPRLQTLQLDAVPVGDAGLAALARCPALRSLRLSGTQATPAGITALRQAAPALSVVVV